jgi:SAM-dependent methyltransferase
MPKNEIKKEDYYSNMYDIERLTDLNSAKRKRRFGRNVSEAERLIVGNKSRQAESRLLALAKKRNVDSRIRILLGALQVKNIVFGKSISLNYKDLSPKNCALRELSLYLKKPKRAIEEKMLVEEPVAEAWGEMKPNPKSEEEIDNFYIETDAYIYELMAANHIVQTLYSYHVLAEKMKKLKIRTILDYGAGAATLSILFKNLNYDVDYADLPGKLFDFAKWRIGKRKLDIPMFDLKKDKIRKKYDCIICTEVFEHVVNPEALLEKLKAHLKKNGALIISESCEYTEDFSSHLESNKKYGGKNFIRLLGKFGFRQVLADPFIPQMIFKRKPSR